VCVFFSRENIPLKLETSKNQDIQKGFLYLGMNLQIYKQVNFIKEIINCTMQRQAAKNKNAANTSTFSAPKQAAYALY